MDVSPLWSFLFFFMMINLALSSITSGVQTFMAFVLDEKPEWSRHRLKILACSCLAYFLMALPMCTNGGIHLFKVFDTRCSSSLLLLSLIEVTSSSAVDNISSLLPSDNHDSLGLWCQEFPDQYI